MLTIKDMCIGEGRMINTGVTGGRTTPTSNALTVTGGAEEVSNLDTSSARNHRRSDGRADALRLRATQKRWISGRLGSRGNPHTQSSSRAPVRPPPIHRAYRPSRPMFQALFFQERDARGDLRAHTKGARSVQVPPAASPGPRANLKKHPTAATLVGGKGLFLEMHRDKQ